jgi:hypothetical protein
MEGEFEKTKKKLRAVIQNVFLMMDSLDGGGGGAGPTFSSLCIKRVCNMYVPWT